LLDLLDPAALGLRAVHRRVGATDWGLLGGRLAAAARLPDRCTGRRLAMSMTVAGSHGMMMPSRAGLM
jgi:hypothetical protein